MNDKVIQQDLAFLLRHDRGWEGPLLPCSLSLTLTVLKAIETLRNAAASKAAIQANDAIKSVLNYYDTQIWHVHTAATSNWQPRMPPLDWRQLSWGRAAVSLLALQHPFNAESKTQPRVCDLQCSQRGFTSLLVFAVRTKKVSCNSSNFLLFVFWFQLYLIIPIF